MKKGFTLIELLAVIVILAIIALIAVPIVVNIINDSRTSSDEQSVELYIDAVQKAIAKKQLGNSSFNPKECKIQNSGNLLCNDVEVNVDMEGKTPEDGVITLSNNKIYYKGLKFNEKYYNNVVKLMSDADNDGQVSIGDKYAYKVNDVYTFNFYVLSIEDNQVNLIMDRNICGTDDETNGKAANKDNTCLIAWNSTQYRNTVGPITSMTALHNATKNWNNVPNMNLIYEDTEGGNVGAHGYKGITIINGIETITIKYSYQTGTEAEYTTIGNKKYSVKARLPKYTEVKSEDDSLCKELSPTCPNWLVENMEPTWNYLHINQIKGIYGYWLLSSDQESANGVRYVDFTGRVSKTAAGITNSFGIRPVITVPIEYLY